MHRSIPHALHIAAGCMALVCMSACAHQSTPLSEQLQSFHELTLRNGIKVIVRQNPLSRIHSVVLTVSGGTCAVAPDKAGLDSVTFELMCMASDRYPDTVRRDILKRTSSAIQTETDLDFSTIQLKTIDTYFAETFDLFLSLITRPAFPPELFREVITNEVNAYRSALTDGYARASRVANRAFFAGHPYASYIATPSTLNNLRLQDVQIFYRHTMVATRLTLFASGNFNLAALQERLEATLGQLPMGTAAPAAPRHFKQNTPTRLLLDGNAQLSADSSYLRGNVAIVPPNHADYYPLELAGRLLSDIMNDVLRTRNALVYSAWAAIYTKKANYANLSAYRTSDPLKALEFITDAVEVLSQGQCVSPYSQKELPGTYIEIDQALGFYKTSFSTEYYASIQDNAAVAQRMAAAHISHGDCRQYLASIDSVNRVTAKDIVRVVNRYLKKGHITWALSAHPDTIATVVQKHSTALPAHETVTLQ